MSIAGSCIGIEIDIDVIRAAILSNDLGRIIGYAEVKRSKKPGDEFEKLSLELKNLWNKLPEKFTGNVRVAATVGLVDAGVRSDDEAELWIDGLEVRRSAKIDRTQIKKSFSYASAAYLESYREAFKANEIPLERLELAPVAAVRVLPQTGSYTFSVGSGIWWEAGVRSGVVIEAEEANIDSHDRALYISEVPGHEELIESLGDITVSQDLLNTFGITESHLAVSVGAALGLQSNEPSFGPQPAEVTIDLEIQPDESPVFDQSKLVDPIDLDPPLGSEFYDSKSEGMGSSQAVLTKTEVETIDQIVEDEEELEVIQLTHTESEIELDTQLTPPSISTPSVVEPVEVIEFKTEEIQSIESEIDIHKISTRPPLPPVEFSLVEALKAEAKDTAVRQSATPTTGSKVGWAIAGGVTGIALSQIILAII